MAGDEIPLNDLLQCLVECSDKAARIAQIFREEEGLFQLLVEEKSDVEKNKRFVQDFKTLADVLVQETIKKDVGSKFSSIISKIQGEEKNTFQNASGESICVELTDSAEETANLLCKVLPDKYHVAEALASAVHSPSRICNQSYSFSSRIPSNTIGIWIDPIDSTAEYIQGKYDEANEYGIQQYGLKCVCVLIGVYDLQTGIPLLGVINQPFCEKGTTVSKWCSKFFWGVNYNCDRELSKSLKNETKQEKTIIVTSSSESEQIQDIAKLKYTVVHVAGAGYKCLLVASKKADLYILSQGTTYYWDTCGPHAILIAHGGGMVNFDDILNHATDIRNADDIQKRQIKYLSDSEDRNINSFRNSGGIIAYRNPHDVLEFLKLLKENGYIYKQKK